MDIHVSHPTAGYHTIRGIILQSTGWLVSPLSVHRSMRRLKIHSCIRRKHYHYITAGATNKKFPNILNRNFSSSTPATKIATDFTYIQYKNKWYYLSCFLDMFNNEILEWELQSECNNHLVIRPARRLLERLKQDTRNQILLHSDQGTQYQSAGYSSLLEKSNVIQSMSRAGTPRDNAVIESFLGRFKECLKHEFKLKYSEDIQKTVEAAVKYFNTQRPVAKLKYKTPEQFRIAQGF